MQYANPIGPIKKGALHRQLGIGQNKPIATKTLSNLKASGTPLEKKRANFALNAKKFNHKKKQSEAVLSALRKGA